MDESNKTINSLWIGSNLSLLEKLTIKSFVDHGHEFHLWTYEEIELTAIPGLVILDANEIIEEKHIFSYKNKTDSGLGKGSVAGFSDIFRYKLLYEKGGWWVDMDVTCTRTFDMVEPYVFRYHNEHLPVLGNVMKCEKGSELMLSCYHLASIQVDENNRDWLKPIKILNEQIEMKGLKGYIRNDLSIPDHGQVIKIMLTSRLQIPEDFYFIHWMNELWKNFIINKDSYHLESNYSDYLSKHNLVDPNTVSEKQFTKSPFSMKFKLGVYRYLIKNYPLYLLILKIRKILKRGLGLQSAFNSIILSEELLIKLKLINSDHYKVSRSKNVR